MLRSSVVAIALGALMQSAAAEPVAVSQWGGFYVGIAAGAGWGTAEQTDTSIFGPFSSGRYHTGGPVFGLSGGYNWQAGAIVVGVETDLSFAAIKGEQTTPGICVVSCESEIQALGTVRGRLGAAFGEWLPFITGGLAYAKLHGSEGPLAGVGGSGSSWVAGYTVGGGAEVKLASQWSAKFEYLFVDLSNHSWTNSLPFGVSARENLEVTAHVMRIAIHYHF